MEWEDKGYILAQKTFSERSLILDVFTEKHGRIRGLVKGSKQKPLHSMQIGVGGSIYWKARLETHLGNLTIEPQINLLPFLFLHPSKLVLLKSLTTMLTFILPENHAYVSLFYDFENFLKDSLPKTNMILLGEDYVHLEKKLLDTLGFGLDINRCALTGRQENLAYVSPKTGRAATLEAGAPYKDNLLKLPDFLTKKEASSTFEDVRNGLTLTSYFLEKHFFSEKQKIFIHLRKSIIQSLNLEILLHLS